MGQQVTEWLPVIIRLAGPKPRLGSFGVLIVSFLTVKEVDNDKFCRGLCMDGHIIGI